MKSLLVTLTLCTGCLGFASLALAQDDPPPDPTRASPRMKAAMMASGGFPELSVKGLVVGGKDGGGLVMMETSGGGRVLARPGVTFTVAVDDEVWRLKIKRIVPEGVEIETEGQEGSIVVPSFGMVSGEPSDLMGRVAYVEFRDLPLLDALRMLGDQTGNNYSASVDANKIAVNAMLRNVPANSVVEEICKSHNLWFKMDSLSGIMRIMTVGEFEKDLGGFREEETVVFTLKYPNVAEVATAIADLYGDRVQLSLGAEAIDDDALTDLEGRFDRFDVLTERTTSAGGLNNNIVGSNVNGFVNEYGGTYGFSTGGGNGGNSDRTSGGNYNRNRYNNNYGDPSREREDGGFRDLTPDQAQRVEQALASERRGVDAAADVEALRKSPATIYVTASRRNNMVVVRSADSRAMGEIRKLVTRMDVQTPLVLLEVKVVSIDLGKEFRSAFDYGYNDGNVAARLITSDIPGEIGDGTIAGGGLNSGNMTFTVVSDNFRARMQIFEEKNRVKNLATPMLLTANNEVSRLFLGEERPLVRGINSQTIITDNNVATTPNTTTEWRNVGTTLLITPNINSDRTVTLRLVQENSFIVPDGASIPVVTTSNTANSGVEEVDVDVVATRSVSGTFVAKDGLAIAVGGLIEDIDSRKRGQIPLLGDIPVLGFFLSRQEKIKSRRELVMIIRPYVMSTPADSERLTEDLLERLAPESLDRLVEDGFLPERPEYREITSLVPLAPPAPSSESKKLDQPKNIRLEVNHFAVHRVDTDLIGQDPVNVPSRSHLPKLIKTNARTHQ